MAIDWVAMFLKAMQEAWQKGKNRQTARETTWRYGGRLLLKECKQCELCITLLRLTEPCTHRITIT